MNVNNVFCNLALAQELADASTAAVTAGGQGAQYTPLPWWVYVWVGMLFAGVVNMGIQSIRRYRNRDGAPKSPDEPPAKS